MSKITVRTKIVETMSFADDLEPELALEEQN
jgi:hypothetical protein